MFCAGTSSMHLRSIRCDGSLPEPMAGLAPIRAVENGTGKAAQAGNDEFRGHNTQLSTELPMMSPEPVRRSVNYRDHSH